MITKVLFASGGVATFVFGAVSNEIWVAAFGTIVSLCSIGSLLYQAIMSNRLKIMELRQTENHKMQKETHDSIKSVEKQTNGMREALENAAKEKGRQEGVAEEKANPTN